MALRVAEKYVGTDAQFQNGQLMLQGQRDPDLPGRSIAINYAGPPGTFPRVSLADFEAAAKAGNIDQLRKWVNGKIVLMGTDFVDDRCATPFYTLFSGPKWTTPGVEIHANTVRTMLERRYLVPVAGMGARALALLLATAVTVWIATSFARQPRACGFVLLEVAASSWLHAPVVRRRLDSFDLRNVAGDVDLPGRLRGLSLLRPKKSAATCSTARCRCSSANNWRRRSKRRRPSRLSGKRMEVTILFTDIRGFTAFTEEVREEQGPEVVVQLLNEYMAMMVGIIVMYHGHVNKFIGDGILAVFRDEDEGAKPGDHALRAVRCATRMVTAPSRLKPAPASTPVRRLWATWAQPIKWNIRCWATR